jgi:hypothetical protein
MVFTHHIQFLQGEVNKLFAFKFFLINLKQGFHCIQLEMFLFQSETPELAMAALFIILD